MLVVCICIPNMLNLVRRARHCTYRKSAKDPSSIKYLHPLHRTRPIQRPYKNKCSLRGSRIELSQSQDDQVPTAGSSGGVTLGLLVTSLYGESVTKPDEAHLSQERGIFPAKEVQGDVNMYSTRV